MKSFVFWLKISLKFVPNGAIDKTSIGLDNGLARNSGKPLFEPMLTQFTDAYMRH